MSNDYTYDEQGQFFPYFILTITGIITLPLTYSAFKRGKQLESTAPRIRTEYKARDADLIEEQKRTRKRSERKLKRMAFSALGWLMMLYMVYLMAVTTRTIPKVWDPYDVLGVARSASEKQIKSHYRGLSLTQHPDKARPDAEKNQTIETINEHWVEITKAFKALTDEEIRNNYLQYGHPDGKQSYSIGIALPKFLVEDGYGKYTLIFYLALLGIFLPYIAGKWWYGTQKVTKDGILVDSAGKLIREYDEDMTEGDVITAVSGGEEYESAVSKLHLSKVEQCILAEGQLTKYAGGLDVLDKDKLLDMDESTRRKVLALLWAHLGRVDLGDEALNKEKFAVAPIAWLLNDALNIMSLAFSNMKPLLSTVHASQNIIQAIPPGGPPLLQLPYFTPAVVQSVEANVKEHLTVHEYLALPSDKRKKLSIGPGLLTEQQYQSAVSTALQFPSMHVDNVWFMVDGEHSVTPNSLCELVIRFRFIPPGTTDVPKIESDGDSQKDRADSMAAEKRKKKQKGEDEDDDEDNPRFAPPLAHAPLYAKDHSPVWYVFLGDAKTGRIAVPPYTYTTFSRPVFGDDGELLQHQQTMSMQFGAPSSVGKYSFVLHIMCDSYMGFDIKEFVTMEVVEADAVEEDPEDDEEEVVPPEDEDESNTDGDVDDDTSETNTDTDEE